MMNIKVNLSPFIVASGKVFQEPDKQPEVDDTSITVFLRVDDYGFEYDGYDITDKLTSQDMRSIRAELIESFELQTFDPEEVL